MALWEAPAGSPADSALDAQSAADAKEAARGHRTQPRSPPFSPRARRTLMRFRTPLFSSVCTSRSRSSVSSSATTVAVVAAILLLHAGGGASRLHAHYEHRCTQHSQVECRLYRLLLSLWGKLGLSLVFYFLFLVLYHKRLVESLVYDTGPKNS